MPFKSEAQRRYMHAKHPEIAERWEHEYPRKKKLPKHVKKAFEVGVDDALRVFGLGKLGGALDGAAFSAGNAGGDQRGRTPLAPDGRKLAGEEIRLKIPNREFHGFDAAFRRAASKADDKTKTAKDEDDEVTMPLPPQASSDQPVEKLVEMLQALPDPKGTNIRETNQNQADSLGWSAPQSIATNEMPSTGTTY